MPLSIEESSDAVGCSVGEDGNDWLETARPVGSPLATTTIDIDEHVRLELRSRELFLAEHTLTQYWVDKRTLVARNGTFGKNFQPILDHFYHQAHQLAGENGEAMETHLLATLWPEVRHDAAQLIFPDASLKRRSAEYQKELLEQLDQMLRTSRDERSTLFEFHEQSRNVVGFPMLSSEEESLYRGWAVELFEGLEDVWRHDLADAVSDLKERWEVWRKRFGRRSNSHLQKTVLNVLSFESKAAFHQCYSTAWTTVLTRLASEAVHPELFANFHGLWHLDQRVPIPGSRQEIHLLHGLVLGLHPAFSLLISTPTGRELIGDAVAETTDIAAQEGFFNAALVSIYQYEEERATYNSSRRKV